MTRTPIRCRHGVSWCQVRESQSLLDVVSVRAGGDQPDRISVGVYGIAGGARQRHQCRSPDKRAASGNDGDQTPPVPDRAKQAVSTNEVALVCFDETIETRFIRADVVSDVTADRVTLLHAQRVKGVVADIRDTEVLTRLPYRGRRQSPGARPADAAPNQARQRIPPSRRVRQPPPPRSDEH